MILCWLLTLFILQFTTNGLTIPSFASNRLSQNAEAIAEALAANGLFALEMPEDYRRIRHNALQSVCSCQDSNYKQTQLADGTIRKTWATVKGTNVPSPDCGPGKTIDRLRVYVAEAAQTFVSVWDTEVLGKSGKSMLQTISQHEYDTIQSIVDSSTQLEHFHVYSKPISPHATTTTSSRTTLHAHTDAGMFLAFVPALNCGPVDNEDETFWAEHPSTGLLEPIQFLDNTVVIMMGTGAEQWLKLSKSVRATRHAVQMNPGTLRAWYGIMYLVPTDAIIQEYPFVATFADAQKALFENKDASSLGCGTWAVSDKSFTPQRRRLDMVGDASVCNNVTNFYCWMSCMDIPKAEHALKYTRQGYSLYCLDPSILLHTGQVTAALEPCIGADGTAGAASNPKCQGAWHDTATGVAAALDIRHANNNSSEQKTPFCYNGSTMYMDGFHWIDKTCLLFLFSHCKLDTPVRLFIACAISMGLTVLVEAVVYRRNQLRKGVGWSAMFYGLQLILSYLAMLIVMTYSIPLFASVIFGFMAGHILFNATDALVTAKSSLWLQQDEKGKSQ